MTIDLRPLLPLVLLSAGAIGIMLTIAFVRHYTLIAILAGIGLIASFYAVLFQDTSYSQAASLLTVDDFTRFYWALVLLAALAVVSLSCGYFKNRGKQQEEYFLLLLLATLGSMVLTASSHFVSFFLGLEILSVSLYALIAYTRTNERSVEAGAKYLILAAASAAFLLFGMALIYAETGTMEFSSLADKVIASGIDKPLMLAGLALMVVGIGFKLAVAPFHLWTPDVYEGAPAPVTAFVATVSKGAMVALLLRFFSQIPIHNRNSLVLIFSLIAVLSMFMGNWLALLQKNVKRILAYSSITHLGYILVAFLAGDRFALSAVTFYLTAYIVTTLGAFGVVTVLSNPTKEADDLEDYRGLGWRHPWLAGVLTATLFSLAGIPLTAGFVGKFYIVTAGVGSALWLLVTMLIINSAIGLYYYLRIVVAIYSQTIEGKSSTGAPVAAISFSAGIGLAVLTMLLLWLGIYPAPFIEIIKAIVQR
jgi:NADH-quinone oxidoreductase subunit N